MQRGSMRMRVGRDRRGENGASLVEFAILAPLLFLLLFGIVEFARLGFAFTEIWTAAREGARYATTVGDTGGVAGLPNFVDCQGIRDSASRLVVTQTLSDADVSIEYRNPAGMVLADCDSSNSTYDDPSSSGNIDSDTQVVVQVQGSFDSVVPLIETFLDGTILDSTQIRSLHLGVVND